MPSTVVPGAVVAAGARAAPRSSGIRSGPSCPAPEELAWAVMVVAAACVPDPEEPEPLPEPDPQPAIKTAMAAAQRLPWIPRARLVSPTAEQAQEEQEDVEDVEEDAGGDRDRSGHRGSAQPVEVEDREGAEDGQPEYGIDDVGVRDRGDDPEHDQRQQGPKQRPRPAREITAGGVAVGAEAGHEGRGGAGGLPEDRRLRLGVDGEYGADGDSEQ